MDPQVIIRLIDLAEKRATDHLSLVDKGVYTLPEGKTVLVQWLKAFDLAYETLVKTVNPPSKKPATKR